MAQSTISTFHVCLSKGPTASAQRVLLEAKGMQGTRVHMQVICRRSSWLYEQLQLQALPACALATRWGWSFWLLFQLARLRPAIVHWYDVDSLGLLLVFRLLGIKNVLTIGRKWSLHRMIRLTLGVLLADYVIAANPSIERSLARRVYLQAKRRSQISLGIDLEPPAVAVHPWGAQPKLRQELGLQAHAFTVGVVIEGKQTSIEAFFQALQAFPESTIQWVVVTTSKASRSILRAAKRFKNLHLLESEKNWQKAVAAMDALYIPSEASSEMPFTALLALKFGVRLLATPEGDVDRLIFSGVSGYQLKRASAQELIQGVVYLLETPCVNKARLMRNLLIDRYSKQEMIEKLQAVYEELIYGRL